jgi:outer membrane receptor protein involved in Fe transport
MCAATAALAQVGGLRVVVTDAAGAPLAGATVTISHETGYIKTTAERTNEQGLVRFPVLRPGSGYRIQVTFPGLSPLRYDDLRVRLNEQQTLPVQMIEELREQVRVTAESGVVDLDKTETSTKFSDEFISDLPVLDRFYQNVLVMAPGVQDANDDGNPNVHGSRNRDFQAIVGSVSNVDPLTGQWLSRINPNSIEEMEVITAGAGVEFGRAQGGFARIIQKQGSNRHEGVVEFHYQTSDLDGNGANDTSSLPDPEFETLQPGFQFSGPVIRDKLWYRASYERRDREEPVNVLSEIAVFTNDSETRDAQLTWQASPRNKLAFKFRSDPADVENFGISSRVPVEASQNLGRDVDTWELTWTAPYSPRMLIETTAAWQDINNTLAPAAPGVPNTCVPNSVVGFLRSANCLDLTTNRISGSYNESNDDRRQRFTFKTQSTVYGGRFLGGDHQLKLGFNVENERYFRSLRRTPSISYDEEFPFGGEPFAIVLADVDVPVDDEVRATGTNWALYVEDQFKPTSNLTFTLGARVDREEIDSEGWRGLDLARELSDYETQELTVEVAEVLGLQATVFGNQDNWERYFTGYEEIHAFRDQISDALCEGVPTEELGHCKLQVSSSVLVQLQEDTRNKRRGTGINLRNTNVSPFFSLAWDPWGDGRTAVKATAGRHYNNIPLIVPLQELEPVRTNIEYRADLATFQTKINGLISSTPTVVTVAPGLETPYQDEYTVSFERELWAETSIQLTYINRQFEKQLQDQNINVTTGDYGVCAPPIIQQFFGVNVTLEPGIWEPGDPLLRDPWTFETYRDTDPGIGDGRMDDCGGVTFFIGTGDPDPFGIDAFRIQSPDGLDDLYVRNPFWGGIFEIGNVNVAEYEALVLELVRRQFRGWQMNASYTYSRAEGDGEDFLQELANDPSLRDSVRGDQSYDQRHVVKLNATTVTPWGIRLGTAVTWQSGLPFSLLREENSDDILPPSTSVFIAPGTRLRQFYPTGERNDQRNASYWNVDIKATKELTVGRRFNLQLSAEVFNALDDDTYLIYNPFFEAGQQVNGVNEAVRRFGRRWQLGVKAAF